MGIMSKARKSAVWAQRHYWDFFKQNKKLSMFLVLVGTNLFCSKSVRCPHCGQIINVVKPFHPRFCLLLRVKRVPLLFHQGFAPHCYLLSPLFILHIAFDLTSSQTKLSRQKWACAITRVPNTADRLSVNVCCTTCIYLPYRAKITSADH